MEIDVTYTPQGRGKSVSDRYVPTTEEIRRHWGIAVPHDRRDVRLAEFDRKLAEHDRQVAEKAWDRCVDEMPIDPDWKNFYGDNNPYRAEAATGTSKP